ncbi:Galactose oxidase/kelch repeat superfamily protein [Trifolium repens]|nr:Galactose oxidase/kelch repeat superfamily protein [Trifolium repens]
MGKNNQHAESSARVCGSKEEEETSIDCFSSFGFRVKESFWKKKHNTKKCVEVNYRGIFLLPDEILEMCLNRLPLTSLKNARLVCKRWSSFVIERRLLRMKNEGRYQNLFLFVFGTLQHGDWSSNRDVNKIHALNLSRNIWYDIDASFLKGRFMFSIAGIRDGIFIVGGRSYNRHPLFFSSGKKTHKGVIFFNALTKSFHKIHSMKYARCVPILGVTESPIIPFIRRRRSHHSNSSSSSKGIKRSFLLIVVGGFDDWSSNHGGTNDDKLMHCGEMYDSLTNKWTEIQNLPSDFGSPYSGIVCGKMFYVVSRTHKLAAYDIEKGFWISIQTPSFEPNKPPYEPKLVSSNGRILLVSNRWPNIRRHIHNLVTTLWELDLMHLTWTEISIDPEVITDWRHIEFVANRNMIFGIKKSYPGNKEILDYFIACDVSESNRAKWNDISSKLVWKRGPEFYDYPKYIPFWTRSMAVIHVSI